MFNSRWHDCSGTGAILQQSLARLFNSHWHDCSTVTGTVVQQSLTLFFNSGWHDSSTVTGTVIQQSLAGLINRGWHDPLTVTGIIFKSTGTIAQQSLVRFSNSHWHDYSTVAGKIFSFFYAGRILQQRCSLLKNRAMYQEYDTCSDDCILFSFVVIHISWFNLLNNIFDKLFLDCIITPSLK